MGKKGSWFGTVKKALRFQPNKDEKTRKLKKKCVSIPENVKLTDVENEETKHGKNKETKHGKNEETRHNNSVALATATTVKATVEVGRLTSAPRYLGETTEEVAAVRLQTAFRGYLARKELRALKGLMRLKSFIEEQSVNQQAATTLRCMRTLARVESQTRTRKIIMSEQNQALQKQLQHKHEKELQKVKSSLMGGDWDISTQSKEQIEAKQQYRQEAAMRREKALAYSFTHQRAWKNPLKPVNQTFMDSNNPQWNWSWLERWMAARPWEIRSELDNNDPDMVKSVIIGITKAYSQGDLCNDYNKRSSTPAKSTQPPSRRSSSTSPSKSHSFSSVSSKIRFPSPSPTRTNMPNRHKRHSAGGLTVSDDEMIESSPPVPSNKMSTKGQSRLPNNGMPERGAARSLKKGLP